MNHMALKGWVGLLLVALLGGCATMTADECMVADWYRLGQQDARDGRQSDFLAQRAGDCREAGIAADVDAWRAGYDEGLVSFCTADNGFRFGLDGNSYRRICPPGVEAGFLQGYDLGWSLNQVSERVNQAGRTLAGIERELQRERERTPVDREKIADLRREQREVERLLRADELELASLRGVAVGRGFDLGRF